MLEKEFSINLGWEENIEYKLEVTTYFDGARNVVNGVSVFSTSNHYLKNGEESFSCEECPTRDDCSQVDKKTNTRVHEFDPKTGELKSTSIYNGDFKEPGFRWGERKKNEIPQNEMSYAQERSAYQSIRNIDSQLKKEGRVPGLKVKEGEELDELQDALKEIVNKAVIKYISQERKVGEVSSADKQEVLDRLHGRIRK
jgi:hypothetical protein